MSGSDDETEEEKAEREERETNAAIDAVMTGKGRTSGRAMLNYDLNYEVPRATDSEYRLRMWL
jgi:hypothetical protein